MYSKLLYPLSAEEQQEFWDLLPRQWCICREGRWEVFLVGDFLLLLLALLQTPRYSCFSKRHKAESHHPRPVISQDNAMFHNFWHTICLHGVSDKKTYSKVAVSTYGKSKWYMLLLPVKDDNVIHRVVHSLQKQWPGCSAGMSIALVLSTFQKERTLLFAFAMPEPVYAQQVASAFGMGVIACTMLPRRVSKSLEWFFKQHYDESCTKQTQVPFPEACFAEQQQVFAVVAKMASYIEFPATETASASSVAQCCILPHLLTLAS